MNSLIPLTQILESVPELPEIARTRSGVEFDPRSDRWAYRDTSDNVSLNFSKLPGVSAPFKLCAKLTLM